MFILFGGILSGVSQGTVNFANTGTFATTADRHVYIDVPGGTKLTGTNYVAALYFGTTADSINQFAVRAEGDESLSRAVAPFRAVDPTSSAAGTWAGGTRYLLGTTVGDQVKLQVRVWDVTKFATFEDARAGGGSVGQSCPFDYTIPLPSDAAGQKMENFVGLPDYRCVPEPSNFALAAFGLTAFLMIHGRHKRRCLAAGLRGICLMLIFIGARFAMPAFGQGTVVFANTGTFESIADRNIYLDVVGGTKLVGTNYAAALYFGTVPDGITNFAVRAFDDQSLYRAIALFRDVGPTSPAAGTWAGGTRTLMGTTGGERLLLQVRVWDINKFSTWDAALAGGGLHGESALFEYAVPPPNCCGAYTVHKINNFRAFALVPEPSELVLATLGVAILLLFRRKRTEWRWQSCWQFGFPCRHAVKTSDPTATGRIPHLQYQPVRFSFVRHRPRR